LTGCGNFGFPRRTPFSGVSYLFSWQFCLI